MLTATIIASLVPAATAAVVISLIPAKILSKMGKALSLMATGLLLTLALTHLLPEAIESGSDIHTIGLTIWGTIIVLIGLEMFFNSNHHAASCPVCAAQNQAHAHRQMQNGNMPITLIRGISHLVPSNNNSDNAATTPSEQANLSVSAPLNLSDNGGFGVSHDEHSHESEHHHSGIGALHHWGHSHEFSLRTSDIEAATKHAEKSSGSMKTALSSGGAPILAGTLFHAICDGVVIASSFMININVGVAMTAAIIAHELPQQLSNYVLMLTLGMNRIQGFIVNLVSMLGALIGALTFYNILDKAESLLPFALAVAGGSFIYVALSDILPRLNRPNSKTIMLLNFGYLVGGAVLAIILSSHH